MTIALASDHGGYDLKRDISDYLKKRGISVLDIGCDGLISVDYPEYACECAKLVAKGKVDRGIVFCGSGIGVSITANRINGVRCALCTNSELAKLSRKHNNSNMLALGGRTTSVDEARTIVDTWLKTEFDGGRHQRRVLKIEDCKGN